MGKKRVYNQQSEEDGASPFHDELSLPDTERFYYGTEEEWLAGALRPQPGLQVSSGFPSQ